jgi:hypothetical protein
MEVFGVFLFAQLFNPLPWHFHVLLAAYNGIGGAIDHSAFYIPGTIIDGRCVFVFFWGGGYDSVVGGQGEARQGKGRSADGWWCASVCL